MTVVENAALPPTLDGIKPAKAKEMAAVWLDRFGIGDRLASRLDQIFARQ